MSDQTCAGKDDGFVKCVGSLTYSFGAITRHGLMCTYGGTGINIPVFPISVEVTMIGHYADSNGPQPDRTIVIGTNTDETWFLGFRQAEQVWTASVTNLNVAYACPNHA
jgi:hypothetical protein